MRAPEGGARRRVGRRGGRLVPLAAGAVAAVVLASCTTGSPSTQRSTTTTHSKQTTTTTTVAPSTTAPPVTTTTAGGPATCQPGQLHLATGASTGAAGTISLVIEMTNTSQATCSMDGYPGMQLLNAQGAKITTTVIRGNGHFPNATAEKTPSLVTLSPGGTAAFALQYEDVPVGNQTSCPSSARAEVTPPNAYTSASMTLDIAPCGNGTVHVSPVYLPS